MEHEALSSIYGDDYECLSTSPFTWAITLFPHPRIDGEDQEEKNYVGVKLVSNIPEEYPEVKPDVKIELLTGLRSSSEGEIAKVVDETVEVSLC